MVRNEREQVLLTLIREASIHDVLNAAVEACYRHVEECGNDHDCADNWRAIAAALTGVELMAARLRL